MVRVIILCVNWAMRGTEESFAALLREAGFEPLEFKPTATGLLVADASLKAPERTSGEVMLEELRRGRAAADRLVEDLVQAWDWQEMGLSSEPPVAKRVGEDPYAFSFDDAIFKMRLSFVQSPAFKVTNFGMPINFGTSAGFDPHCDCPSCMAMRFPPPEPFDCGAVWAGY